MAFAWSCIILARFWRNDFSRDRNPASAAPVTAGTPAGPEADPEAAAEIARALDSASASMFAASSLACWSAASASAVPLPVVNRPGAFDSSSSRRRLFSA
jgi:hypothetical protein